MLTAPGVWQEPSAVADVEVSEAANEEAVFATPRSSKEDSAMALEIESLATKVS